MMRGNTLQIIRCDVCGWHTAPMNRAALEDLGCPWYCADCGRRCHNYIEFTEDERMDALRLANDYQRRRECRPSRTS